MKAALRDFPGRKPFQNVASRLSHTCVSAACSVGLEGRSDGGKRSARRRGCQASLFFLCSVTGRKTALSHFKSSGFCRFFKGSRKRIWRILRSHSNSEPPLHLTLCLRNFQGPPSYETLSWLRQTAHCLWYLRSLHFWWNKPVGSSWVRKTKGKKEGGEKSNPHSCVEIADFCWSAEAGAARDDRSCSVLAGRAHQRTVTATLLWIWWKSDHETWVTHAKTRKERKKICLRMLSVLYLYYFALTVAFTVL